MHSSRLLHIVTLREVRHAAWGLQSRPNTSECTLTHCRISHRLWLLAWRESLIIQEGQDSLLWQENFQDFVSLLLRQVLVIFSRGRSCSWLRCALSDAARVVISLFVGFCAFLGNFLLDIVHTHTQVFFQEVASFNLLRDLGLDMA